MAIYTATTGVDNLSGTTDWDTFVIGADVMLQAGDVFNGGAESFNDIRLDAFGAGAHSWQFNLATFSNFEAVIFNPDSAGTLTVYANANQFGPGPNAAALQVTGSALTSDNIDITFTAPATYNFNTWTFDNWLAGPDGIFLRGSDAGADTIGGTSQTDDIFGGAGDDILSGNNGGDYIVGGAGNDTIDGGDGSDVVQYSSAASNFYVYLAAGGNLVVIDTTGAEGTDSVINTQYLRFITDAYSTAIYTTNNAATASIAGPYLIQQGQGVAISATASDADVAENDAITYAWDLDNDGQFDDSTTLSPTLTAGQLTTLGINTAGAHTLSLRVTDPRRRRDHGEHDADHRSGRLPGHLIERRRRNRRDQCRGKHHGGNDGRRGGRQHRRHRDLFDQRRRGCGAVLDQFQHRRARLRGRAQL